MNTTQIFFNKELILFKNSDHLTNAHIKSL